MVTTADPIHDRVSELRAFDETKAGVKGLVDAGITLVPHIFVRPPDTMACGEDHVDIPMVDLGCMNAGPTRHEETVWNMGLAMEKWGFLRVINHGVPKTLVEEVIEGSHRFFEQEMEAKKGFYTRDFTMRVIYNSNMALYNSQLLIGGTVYFAPWDQSLPSLRSCPKLADQIGGLQVLHENKWIDVPPIPGALVINIGDQLQLITNDRFKSVEHQVSGMLFRPHFSAIFEAV
ncbi:1-aminocyclopropane-1-carboxylate oxidase homolog [Eucalyptus grandis]|uniref:1-aminocyclopropane-1-carboxylate oxidase homolog n=1 Tax=Eucalyptus grandis TaxID=71139 RepID=UPI00192E8098|nr:1-aminocyclopropane-1-carboxylate oxidase homolog [Eucalyptus grandis]